MLIYHKVWVESEEGHGYGKMIFKDTESSSKSSLKSDINLTTKLSRPTYVGH